MTSRNPSSTGKPEEVRPTTFAVRVWAIKEIKNKTKPTTYQVRWKVGMRPWAKNYATKSLAEARRAELLAAAKKGEAFDIQSGLPIADVRAQTDPEPAPLSTRAWLEHARDFADTKWDERQAPGTRRSLADALATVTPALLTAPAPAELAESVREALFGWTFQSGTRRSLATDGTWAENPPPPELEAVLGWLARHSRPIADLADDPELIRSCLNVISQKLDGKPAAANTVLRKRIAFGACLAFAVERGDLAENPLPALSRTAPKTRDQVDRRVCVNHHQAQRLLEVGVRPVAPDLVAWYGGMYYGAMRPGEMQELREPDLELPRKRGCWGIAILVGNNPEMSGAWTDDGERTAGPLKHRAAKETREVPLHPLLVDLYHRHLDEFGTATDGRLFRGERGGPVTSNRHQAVWQKARQRALTPAEIASPLARRPYDLRHAAVSTWLNAGVPPTQIAEWAGHSVAVLLHTYAKCIVGQDEAARRRIEAALRLNDDPPDESTPRPQTTESNEEQ
ncbi:tyrosine-type recombinase/integrase [Frankia sp. Cas3]|uniref:tyrosine-type recombinase/integrase n=1 Tax=Frankia sp. Cas3 TaxID=3073926 RepID=UPI002AD561ED|nr:tyrosine-type recombinase/integrase [Frankia sp. Cas3]